MGVAFVIVETPSRVCRNVQRAKNNLSQINNDYHIDCEEFQYQLRRNPQEEPNIRSQWQKKYDRRSLELKKQEEYLKKSFLQKIYTFPPTPFYMDEDDE